MFALLSMEGAMQSEPLGVQLGQSNEFVFRTSLNESKTYFVNLYHMELYKRHELRISWSAASPISVSFSFEPNFSPAISDEKAVFDAPVPSTKLNLTVKGTGVAYKENFWYNVTAYAKLERVYLFGLTKDCWLLTIVLVLLSGLLAFVSSYFGASFPYAPQ